MGGNCLAAALMLFQEAHPSSKLGDVPLKTPCIISLMMLPPKQSQKIIQSCRIPWRNCRLPWRNSLTAALMLFQEPHPSSKLGDVPLKTPCIIFFDDVTSQTISKNYSKLPLTMEKLPPTMEEQPLAMEEQPPTLEELST